MLNIIYKEKTTIFQRIETLIRTQGELPENFEPEEREYAENELRFAPGALEGIFGHHTSGNSDCCDFADTLKEYLQLKQEEALKRFETEEAGSFSTATIRGGLLKEIINHQEEYNADKVANLGYYFALKGTKCETVKLGLSLLALFNFSENDKVCYLLKNLGYCEEFTGYVTMNVSDWEEQKKQDFYFELAKKLKGWGKIDVVEEMVADTEEKKEWLLCHGCKNSILYAYLALVCAEKCDFFERLKKGNLTDEQFQGATDIMDGLLDEGPCDGMSAIEKPVELTLAYLEELQKHETDIRYAVLLCWIYDYFQDNEIEEADRVCERIRQIFGGLDVNKLIAENLSDNPHNCIQIAKRFDVDLSEQLFALMKQNFEKYFTYCYYLFDKNKLVEEFFALCEQEIDAAKYPKRMGASLGLGRLGEGVLALDMIVQYMGKYPLQGRKLLLICIQSPFTRWRNMAAKAMIDWVEGLNKPLSDIDVGLYDMVSTVAEIECNDTTKEMWEKLL